MRLHKPTLACWTLVSLSGMGLPLAHVVAQTAATTELNLANQAELEQVAGLGPQLADRLLQARRDGVFLSWADAQNRVRGLGPASAKRLSDHGLRVNGEAWAPKPSP